MERLSQSVGKCLATWELIWPPVKASKEMRAAWLAVMASESVTAEEFEGAAVLAAKRLTFWPKPVEIIDIVSELRKQAWEDRLARHVEAIDANGVRVLAPKDRVRDGRIVRNGELPNGISVNDIPALDVPATRAEVIGSMKSKAAIAVLLEMTGATTPEGTRNESEITD